MTSEDISTALGYTPRKAWYVDITGSATNTLTSSKTIAEIRQAYDQGYSIFCRISVTSVFEGLPITLPLYCLHPSADMLAFGGTCSLRFGGSSTVSITLTYNQKWYLFVDEVINESTISANLPTSLKNPNALTIKIGSETVTYDGSAAKTVEIADGTEVRY